MKYRIAILAACVMLAGAGCQRIQAGTDVFPYPHVGSTATFQYYPRWQVSGSVTIKDEHTLHFDHFTFQGDKLGARLVILNDTKYVGQLEDLTGQHVSDVSFDESLPQGMTLDGFNLVSVLSTDMSVPVSSAKFSQ